eukprot:CAMPEP_0203931720 /NCGR_PEP_ID=MMETSP0359-20131031/70263_1 /ASSEMBLY_ACC=CAM_ASM_000338 /TAXON_ID=268821 /ORGANISM="Scrippsiella Hangoei, Strain SHTV-5" /LENGTH=834 /DNA_ID=CAMNT_0050861103 /DNA_START=30 /DNA_END=2531 /DNA_ORIENTATION=-
MRVHVLLQDLPWGWGVAAGVLMVCAYFCNERSCLHRAVVERIFWPLIYGWFALLWLRRPSSERVVVAGQAVDDRLTPTGMALVFIAALLGLAVYTHNRRQRMASRLSFGALQRVARTLELQRHVETVPARVATARLAGILGANDHVPGLFEGLTKALWEVASGRRFRKQGAVLAALRGCWEASPADLLYIFNSGDVDLPSLFALAGTSAVMDLVRQLIPHMDVVTKARLIDALHRQPGFMHGLHLQQPVVEMFQQTCGQELSSLKCLVDELGDFYSLHRLVFFNLASQLREVVLRHLEAEGLALRASLLARPGASSVTSLPRKVLSDIDDTLFSSGGHFPAGVDGRYPKKQIYPGVLALYRELDRQRQDDGSAASNMENRTDNGLEEGRVPLRLRLSSNEWVDLVLPATETIGSLKDWQSSLFRQQRLQQQQMSSFPSLPSFAGLSDTRGSDHGSGSVLEVSFEPQRRRAMSNLAFLSARPHAYKDYMESRSYQFFWSLHNRGMLHCMPTLLAGRLGSSLRAALLGALLKFWLHLLALLLALCLLAYRANYHCVPSLLLLGSFLGTFAAARRWRKVVWVPVGISKVATFREYQKLYSECSFVFCGDNGQADLLCGEMLAPGISEKWMQPQSSQLPLFRQGCDAQAHAEALEAVFIHEVTPRAGQLSSLPEGLGAEAKEEAWRRGRIYFHRTYVGAAINAFHCGLVSAEGVARVGQSAVEDMVRMRIDRLHDARCPWAALIDEMNTDIDRANALLSGPAKIERVPDWVGTQFLPETFGSQLPGPAVGESTSTWGRARSDSSGADTDAFSFRTRPPRSRGRAHSGRADPVATTKAA